MKISNYCVLDTGRNWPSYVNYLLEKKVHVCVVLNMSLYLEYYPYMH